MNAHVWFWAKLGTATWPEMYHPAICHLIDVASVAQLLWDQVLRQRFRSWFAARLGLEEAACGRWLAFWAGSHDVGKVTPCFQDRGDATARLRHLLGGSFNFPEGNKPHGLLSTRILDQELTAGTHWPALDAGTARNVAVAVGGHHGVFPTNWDGVHAPLGNGAWAEVRRELLACLARHCGVLGLAPPTPPTRDDHSVWMCLAGITSVADWIGSNQTYFPPVGSPALVAESLDLAAYGCESTRRADTALDKLGWRGRMEAMKPVGFNELFPFISEPRPLQKAVAERATERDAPGLLIVEAPMGEGKTEAAWYAAACWDRAGGQGTYVALPTMATSNQMFERVERFLQVDGGKQNLMLQHGKAALNERFAALQYAAQVYDDEHRPAAVVAEQWFASNKKHGLLAPYGVGTIDQALLAVLQTRHVFVRLFGLAGKCVILDEVHAYDAYMTTLLERLLSWLAALGCPVVLLSATLPHARRLQLLRAYAGEEVPEPEHVPYPRLTEVTRAGLSRVTHIEADPSRARTVQLGWLQEEALADHLRQTLADGGCAVVIRNTVGLAQTTYTALRERLHAAGIQVELFHARFPFGRRRDIESTVLQRFGRHGAPAERDRRILVATQVVEQSLDLDFDVMVSDVAPVDLVLQRAGRLHRHDRGARPAGVHTPQLWLIEPGTKDGIPRFGPAEYVYARFVLLRSYAALKANPGVQLPGDLEALIEQVYGKESLAMPAHWHSALQEAERELCEHQERQQLHALDLAIRDPDREPLEQQCLQLEEDDPEASPRIQAHTRDSDCSIQAIVMYHLQGADYLDMHGQEPFHEAKEPSWDEMRRLLENEVSINHRTCFKELARSNVPSGWRQKGVLRHHRILRVDGEGYSLPGHFSLRLDPELGLVFRTE